MSHSTESTRTLAAIMFADIVGYTAMMQEDEEHAKQLRDRHRDVIEQILSAYSGEIIQYYGDGSLSLFSSAKQAILAARNIQCELRKDPNIPLRIGIHLGEVTRDEAGVYGDCVNVASRIESLAIPGAVLYSDKINAELENHPSIKSVSLGEFHFKNIRRPIQVFALDDPDLAVPDRNHLAEGKLKAPEKSVAVLPFDHVIGNEENGYLALGISEGIVNGLNKIEGISTISRTTCNAIKKNREDLVSVRNRLNVSHVLEGSVHTADDKVQVSVQLVNTADGFQVWSDVILRDLDDLFTVQNEIARHVVNGLKISFEPPSSPTQIVTKQTNSPEAYRYYLKGQHQLDRNTPAEGQKAIELFSKALELDPTFAAAKCALSNCYAFLGSCGAMNPLDAYNKAQRYALQAIEQNPHLAEAHLAMAVLRFYHFWDWEGAHESLDKARDLGLNTALLHQVYGLYYAATGEHTRGIERMQKALELDPLSVPVMYTLGTLYIFNEQYHEAIAVFEEILELDPAFRSALQAKGVSLVCLDRVGEAMKLFHQYHEMVNHPDKGLIGLIIGNHMLGKHDVARDYVKRLHNRLERERGGAVEVDLGIVHCILGNISEAFRFLNNVYDKRFSIACLGMIWVIRCPLFKDVWNHKDYLDLLQRMELKPLRA